MIEEVVNSILEAEDVAKRRVAEAEQKAAEIVAAAERKADEIKKQAAVDNKVCLAEQLAKADVDAEKAARETFEDLKVKADSEVASRKSRVDDAVKIILEQL